jgi:transcriptional regulator with XRE-family HTH domain
MNDQLFHERLRECKKKSGVTSLELKEVTGISHARINHMMWGKSTPTLKELSMLATAMDASIDYILGVGEAWEE